MNIRLSLSPLAALAAALLIGGCALSPQTIDVAPSVTVEPAAIGQGRTLALDVVDKRPRAYFGTRGGVYGVTSTIGPTGDVSAGVRKAMAEALTAKGFRVVPAGSAADLLMRLDVEDISYVASGDPVVRSVETAARIGAVIRRGDNEYSGRAQVKQSKDVITAPDAAQNETLINATLSQALERLLKNNDLVDFLR